MPTINRVKTVNEAVALAQKWKDEGKYDWFRGQTYPWKIIPSIGRFDVGEQNETYEKIERFLFWLKSTSGLEELSDDQDKAVAVAQHYGIPTTFVDFTTEPEIAGFFATYGKQLEPEQECSLYCLNTLDLKELWEAVRKVVPEYPSLEFLTPNVKDLWRLEAQHGVFLYCPLNILEDVYSIDKISFPFSETFDIPVEKIYPTRKSSLELLIDQFLMAEVSRAGNQRIRSKWEKMGGKIVNIPLDREDLDEYFIKDKIDHLESWSGDKTKIWLITREEKWNEVYSEEAWEFEIPPRKMSSEIISLKKALAKNIRSRLKSIEKSRNKLVRWKFRFREGSRLSEHREDILQNIIQRVFDGMRILPFSEADMAEAISTCVVLSLLWIESGKKRANTDWIEIFEPLIKDGIEIDLGSFVNSGSKAVVSKKRLQECVRSDLEEILSVNNKPELNPADVYFLIQFIKTPSQLFDFDALNKVFVSQIIPTQAVMQTENEPLYFTPARLQILGNR